MYSRSAARLVLILAAGALLGGCYERKMSIVLNPDGSGKVMIETDVPVPTMDAPGKEKPTAVTFGRQLAADFINATRGVDAWSDVSVSQAADGRAHIQATAYFPDITRLQFDLPVIFTWEKDDHGAFTFGLTRAHNDSAVPLNLSEEQLKDHVAKAQLEYKETQPALQTALTAFRLEIECKLPGDVVDSKILQAKGRTVSLALEGKKIISALDKFMADSDAIAATIKTGRDFSENDDILLEAMYGRKGPVTATVKLAADAPPFFDYKTEERVAERGQPDMLQAAGVVLIQPFIVKPPPSQQPAGRSSRGR